MHTALEKVGLLCLALVAFRIAKALLTLLYTLLAPALRMHANLPDKGRWAVITGSTDGLGRAFADHLAKLGMDIVLISRNKTKLEIVASEIAEQYKVNTKIVEADFTQGNKIFAQIEKELFSLEIGVLVNNVGISYPYPEYFLQLINKEKIYNDIVQCNILSMLSMCQIVMPGMVEQRKGVIINISSSAADIPSPLLSVYGASKVFVSKFTKDLATEYKKHGLIITCLVPGYIATKMSKIKKPTWMAPSPSEYVESALKTVGLSSHTTGYFPHTILLKCIGIIEKVSPALAEWMVIRTMENIRERAIRKIPDTLN